MPLWTLFGLHQGKATTAWPGRPLSAASLRDQSASGQDGVLGMPRFEPARCGEGCRDCADACPTGAITVEASGRSPERGKHRLEVDYGRCIACQLCVEACPQGVATASNDWAFGVRDKGDLRLVEDAGKKRAEAADAQPDADRAESRKGFRRSLHIRHVDAGSDNACESELQALNNPFYNLHRFGIFFTPSPRYADLLLVTGPVTYAMRGPLLEAYEAMPELRWVMAVGTEAVSGALTGDGYACGNGVDEVLPVDLYLPGSPPNPAAIIEALLMFLDRLPQRAKGGRLVD